MFNFTVFKGMMYDSEDTIQLHPDSALYCSNGLYYEVHCISKVNAGLFLFCLSLN